MNSMNKKELEPLVFPFDDIKERIGKIASKHLPDGAMFSIGTTKKGPFNIKARVDFNGCFYEVDGIRPFPYVDSIGYWKDIARQLNVGLGLMLEHKERWVNNDQK